MLEDIKTGTYKGIASYLVTDDIQALRQWYENYSLSGCIADEELVNLLYELYIREDIDFRPREHYKEIVSTLARKYHFDSTNFLSMYQQYRTILFG